MQNHHTGDMELVVSVAIGVLSSVAFISLVIVLAVVIHKFCRNGRCLNRSKDKDLISRHHRQSRPAAHLVDNMEGPIEVDTDMELDDVNFKRSLDRVLSDECWVNDATGLVPDCLAILKICHALTEKLVGMTMGNATRLRNQGMITELVTVAKRISPRVDAVVRAMYPPLDPRLLEARCTALVLSVTHLVIVTKNACHLSGVLDWVEQSLADLDQHLQVLCEASTQYETLLQSNKPETDNVQESTTDVQTTNMNSTNMPNYAVNTLETSPQSESTQSQA